MGRAKKRFLVDENGRKQSVVIPIKEYQELLEDLEDLAVFAERNQELTEPLDAVGKRLQEKWRGTESK